MPIVNGQHRYHTAIAAEQGYSFKHRADCLWRDLWDFCPEENKPSAPGLLEAYQECVDCIEEEEGRSELLRGFVLAVAVMHGISKEDQGWLSDAWEWVGGA